MKKLSDALKAGDGNVSDIVTTGASPLTLNDMVWIDLVGSITGSKIDATAGKIDFNFVY